MKEKDVTKKINIKREKITEFRTQLKDESGESVIMHVLFNLILYCSHKKVNS
jgi:hypothetical protein